MPRRRSRIEGPNKLRRKLRRMEPAVQREVQDALRDGLNRMQRDAQALAPRREGDLRDAIEVKLSRDKMSGVVGPGVSAAEIVRRKTGSPFGVTSKKVNLRRGNKRLMLQFFKGYWAEFGTKGTPDRNIPPQQATPFMRPAYDSNIGRMLRAAGGAINRALNRAARG